MRRFLAGALVSAVIALHMGWSSRIPLDWPTIALVGIVVAIVFAPEVSRLLPFIKRIKVGEAEIELQESVQKLHQEVEKAEESTGSRAALRESHTNRVKAVQEKQGTQNAILALAAQDKESAVVRLTIEIEKELAALFHANGLGTEPPKTIRELVNKLVEKKVLSPSTGTAILEFRDVRNQVIHPRQAFQRRRSRVQSTAVFESSAFCGA
jgi:uncharacterized protein YutE (UPF0331/DUF86 family)